MSSLKGFSLIVPLASMRNGLESFPETCSAAATVPLIFRRRNSSISTREPESTTRSRMVGRLAGLEARRLLGALFSKVQLARPDFS
jgi:hypothetical protein